MLGVSSRLSPVPTQESGHFLSSASSVFLYSGLLSVRPGVYPHTWTGGRAESPRLCPSLVGECSLSPAVEEPAHQPVDSATTAMTHGLHLPCLKKPLCGPRCFHLTPGNDFHLLAMSLQALKAVFQSRIPGVPYSWTFWLAPSSSRHIAGSLLSKSAFSEGNCGYLSKMPLSLPLSCDCRKGWIFLLAWTQPSLPPSLRTAMHDGRGWSLWNAMHLI